MKMVVSPALDEARLTKLQDAAGSMQVVNTTDESQAAMEIVEADAFFGKITPTLLGAARQLKWVQSPTASLEHYLFPELIEHPCQLTNMRGLFSDVIADHVMGYVLCFARNLHLYLRQQIQRKWAPIGGEEARSNFTSGPGVVNEIDRKHLHLADCTLGVIGVGAIGAEIAARAKAFGMHLLGIDSDRRTLPGIIEDIWEPSRLSELLGQCDFVVIAAPHTPETYKLFRRPQFESMRKSAFLINIGRGVIVDLADVTLALQEGLIAGAALDVFEIEPLPADHPLWNLENAILTPHIAAASPRIAERHLATLLENTRCFVAGKPLITPVDKRRWF